MTFLNLNDLNDDTTLKIVDVFNVDSYYHAFKVNLFQRFSVILFKKIFYENENRFICSSCEMFC